MIDDVTLLRASDREMVRILSLPEKRRGAFLAARMVMLDHALRREGPGASGGGCGAPGGRGLALWDRQLESLLELDPAVPRAGYFGQQGVGSGKAAISFLLPSVLAEYRARTRSQRTGEPPEIRDEDWPVTLLLVPSDMHRNGRGQTFQRYAAWAEHYHLAPLMEPPSSVGPRPKGGTYIVSHGQASVPKGTDLYQRIQPELVVIDEAHRFAGSSARSRRLFRWLADPTEGAAAYGIQPRLAVMSGTLWKRSLRDFEALLGCALPDTIPLPVTGQHFVVEQVLDLWCSMLDAHGEPDVLARAALAPLMRYHELVEAGVEPDTARRKSLEILNHPDRYRTEKVVRSSLLGKEETEEWRGYVGPTVGLSAGARASVVSVLRRRADTHRSVMPKAREAFEHRLRTLRGVQVTSSASCDARIVLEETPEPSAFRKEVGAFDAGWRLPPTPMYPDGEEILEAKDAVRHRALLLWGVVRQWDWTKTEHPNGDEEWLEARRAWNAALDTYKRNHSRVGLDSDALIEAAAKAGDLGPTMERTWGAWADVKDRYWSRCPITGTRQNQPPGRIVFLDRERTRNSVEHEVRTWVAARARKGQPFRGIVWYSTPIFEDIFRELGYSVFGAGTDAPPDNEALPFCSIRVHGTGKNLQGGGNTQGGGNARERGWSENLFLQPPRHNDAIEQAIGRTHRPGQAADEVGVRMVGGLLEQVWREAEAMPGKARLLLADRVVRPRATLRKT